MYTKNFFFVNITFQGVGGALRLHARRDAHAGARRVVERQRAQQI